MDFSLPWFFSGMFVGGWLSFWTRRVLDGYLEDGLFGCAFEAIYGIFATLMLITLLSGVALIVISISRVSSYG